MDLARKAIRGVLVGIAFSSSIYLISKLFSKTLPISKLEIFSVLLLGAFIGLFSLIFEMDEYLSFLAQLIIHFFLTTFTVFIYAYVNNVHVTLIGGSLGFISIYIVVWLIVKSQINHDIKEINQKLSAKKNEDD
ncbi:DUF3021 domain-containing protein [Oenococcus oeni]|uniref:DUF3021 domain-containing protein n=1 Tax=Oenococcus oeni TaxID=1247 RepID=UPI0008F8164C|nr:DUF3021 domain-containing protein [Oenococcus oeni]OIK57245.1 hypothetical protein ATW61_03525 [Oenococcus oeni]OIM27012.1 hypothetical protein ATX61_03550 [Oenococcus oeni]OIM63985.1 hypothetical protein ATX87_03520 [Oenococcus oeni]SYW16328.1 conserved membrane hypothetical protein [Oenococcus oeni]